MTPAERMRRIQEQLQKLGEGAEAKRARSAQELDAEPPSGDWKVWTRKLASREFHAGKAQAYHEALMMVAQAAQFVEDEQRMEASQKQPVNPG